MGEPVIVVHGCCKGARDALDVQDESLEGALAVGAQSGDVRTLYYACALNQAVISGGHTADLPDDCERPTIETVPEEHMDTDWDQAMEELLADPANAWRIARLIAEDPSIGDDVGVEGFYPTGRWADVHVYLSRRHEPHGKSAVWESMRGGFDGLDGGYVLIAHSLGSIVSAYLLDYGFVPKPRAFVTVGSQLGWSALTRWLSPFHLEGAWINIIDRDDVSSGFFSRDMTPKDNGYSADDYRDLWVDNVNRENPHDFRGYMRTPGAIGNVGQLL